VDPAEEPDAWVAMILPVIDEHHALRAEWTDQVALDVYGAGATPPARIGNYRWRAYRVVFYEPSHRRLY
jgi:hypothetical protein